MKTPEKIIIITALAAYSLGVAVGWRMATSRMKDGPGPCRKIERPAGNIIERNGEAEIYFPQ